MKFVGGGGGTKTEGDKTPPFLFDVEDEEEELGCFDEFEKEELPSL